SDPCRRCPRSSTPEPSIGRPRVEVRPAGHSKGAAPGGTAQLRADRSPSASAARRTMLGGCGGYVVACRTDCQQERPSSKPCHRSCMGCGKVLVCAPSQRKVCDCKVLHGSATECGPSAHPEDLASGSDPRITLSSV